jgi:hypothetical protein
MIERLPISVSMTARNEARSLGSVGGWVAEMVVVINNCESNSLKSAQNSAGTHYHQQRTRL